MLTKDYFVPMAESSITNAINSFRKGSMHYVEWLDGAAITLDSGEIYVTKRALCRFKINYSNLPTVRIEKAILKSTTADQIKDCETLMGLLREDQKAVMSKRVLNVLEQKKLDLAVGKPIYESEKKSVSLEHDAVNPFLLHCKNGNTLVQCYNTFSRRVVWKDGVRSFEPRKIETRYYFVDKTGHVELLDPTDPKIAKVLEKVKETARTAAGKKAVGGGPTLIMTISVHNIIALSDKKEY